MLSWKGITGWLWLSFFVGLVIFHFGPGRVVSKLDTLESLISEVRSSEALGLWEESSQTYSKALNLMHPAWPDSWADKRLRAVHLQLKLAKARSEMLAGRIKSSLSLLEDLFFIQELPDDNLRLHSEIRATLAQVYYSLGWKSRCELGDDSGWGDDVEKAVSHFRWLSEWALTAGDLELVERYRANLELAIRLSRMKRPVFEDLTKQNSYKFP
jgi:tetratricopeptide (TPR) repeat protein